VGRWALRFGHAGKHQFNLGSARKITLDQARQLAEKMRLGWVAGKNLETVRAHSLRRLGLRQVRRRQPTSGAH
jgi:hypothetical protein